MGKVSRPQTVTYRLPEDYGIEIARPEDVLLQLGDVGRVDIGRLCFLNRESPNAIVMKKLEPVRAVDAASYEPSRRALVRRLIDLCHELMTQAALRPATVRTRVKIFTNLFMTWADSSGHSDATDNPEAARRAIRGYVAYVREEAMQGRLLLGSAVAFQNAAADTLAFLVGSTRTELLRGLQLLSCERGSGGKPTEVPDEKAQSRVLALCWSVFEGLSTLVVEGRPYPYQLAVPEYLAYPGNALWVFPAHRWCAPPEVCASREESGVRPFWAYRFAEGRLAIPDEIREHYSVSDSANLAIRRASQLLQKANDDLRHYTRLTRGGMAAQAFFLLFLAHTGMNLQSAFDLEWGEDFEVGLERQGFRTVKWRANGKRVSFEIQARLLPAFRRYLALREYLLGGRSFGLLFFSLGYVGGGSPHKLVATDVPRSFQNLCQVDPTLPYITARQWRAALSDWLVRYHDVSVAARLLQNSEQTVLKRYTAGSNSAHLTEMGAFLDRVSEVVLARSKEVPDAVQRATGLCTRYGEPHAVGGDIPPVTPDCRRPEGCLFCDKYRVHADETDVRKLMSCLTCMRAISKHASSQEQHDRLFGHIFARIEELLGAIREREEALVDRVAIEVDEGELDPYWASKLEMLQELELV